MAWILDEYSKFHGHSPAIVTGKPIVSIKSNSDHVNILFGCLRRDPPLSYLHI